MGFSRASTRRRGPVDDRGRPCALAALTPAQRRARLFGVRTSKLDEQMRFESRKFLVAEVVVVVVSTALGFLASERFIVPAFPSIAGGPWAALVGLTSAVFGGWLGWTLMIQNIRLREWAALSAHALRLGRCPACGYDLRSTPAGGEGFTTCPECGAAWKPDRLRTSNHR